MDEEPPSPPKKAWKTSAGRQACPADHPHKQLTLVDDYHVLDGLCKGVHYDHYLSHDREVRHTEARQFHPPPSPDKETHHRHLQRPQLTPLRCAPSAHKVTHEADHLEPTTLPKIVSRRPPLPRQSSANLRHKMPSSLPALVSQSHKKMKESIKSEELSLPLLIERDSKLNSSNTCSTLNQIGHQKVLPDIRPPQSKQSLKSDDSSTNLACPDTNELPSIARDARPNAKESSSNSTGQIIRHSSVKLPELKERPSELPKSHHIMQPAQREKVESLPSLTDNTWKATPRKVYNVLRIVVPDSDSGTHKPRPRERDSSAGYKDIRNKSGIIEKRPHSEDLSPVRLEANRHNSGEKRRSMSTMNPKPESPNKPRSGGTRCLRTINSTSTCYTSFRKSLTGENVTIVDLKLAPKHYHEADIRRTRSGEKLISAITADPHELSKLTSKRPKTTQSRDLISLGMPYNESQELLPYHELRPNTSVTEVFGSNSSSCLTDVPQLRKSAQTCTSRKMQVLSGQEKLCIEQRHPPSPVSRMPSRQDI